MGTLITWVCLPRRGAALLVAWAAVVAASLGFFYRADLVGREQPDALRLPDDPKLWLALASFGGLSPPGGAYERLTIDTDGKATVVLTSPRDNGCIGTFERVLSEERLRALRQAVRRANLRNTRAYYPPPKGAHDLVWVIIAVVTPRGTNTVRASSQSWLYPGGLKRLYDVRAGLPGTQKAYAPEGILSRLIAEVSASPVSAISGELQVPKRSFRVGERIAPVFVVKNVGTEPVAVVSTDCREIAFGELDVALRHHPLPPEGAASHLTIDIGPRRVHYHDTLTDAARKDLENVALIEPGEEWRIRMPKAFFAPSAGEYELVGSFAAGLLYNPSLLEKELGRKLVAGWLWVDPVRIRVTE